MGEGINHEPIRKLTPLSDLDWRRVYTYGIPPDPSPNIDAQLKKELLKTGPIVPNTTKIPLSVIYPTQEALKGDDAVNSRFVFHLGSQLDDGGTATIHRAMDRLLGLEGVAKIISTDYNDEDRPRHNTQIQLEGELMTALDQDAFLRQHVVQVWDIARVIVDGKENAVIFEEYMDPKKQPLLEYAKLKDLTGQERLKLIEQLCITIDRLAEYGIYHHDLCSRNVYIDLEKKQIKIGDFGASNIALDTSKYEVEAHPGWVSPERSKQKIGDRDTGLTSEVFPLSTLAYYLLTGGDIPYKKGVWPKDRATFMNKSKEFKTGFYSESREDLKKYAGGLFGEAQLDRIADVLEKGLAISPESRYQSGKELMQAINTALLPDEIV